MDGGSKTHVAPCGQQKKAVERLRALLWGEDGSENQEELEESLWAALLLHQNVPFATAKGLTFTYHMKQGPDGGYGNEVFFSRKEKSITRATVKLAFERAVLLQKRGPDGRRGAVSGPKKLGVFGASYLYPVFVKLGVILEAQEGGE